MLMYFRLDVIGEQIIEEMLRQKKWTTLEWNANVHSNAKDNMLNMLIESEWTNGIARLY